MFCAVLLLYCFIVSKSPHFVVFALDHSSIYMTYFLVFGDHTRDFLDLACLTHYPDHPLCVFYNTSFNEWLKVHLPIEGSRESFAQYVEWVLVQCDSLLTACPNEEDIACPTPDPEPSQLSAMPAEKQPEPTMKQKPNDCQRLFMSQSLSLTWSLSRCRGHIGGVHQHRLEFCPHSHS